MKYYLGIDPGKSGCVMLINQEADIVYWFDIPTYKREMAWSVLFEKLKNLQVHSESIVACLVEKQQIMHKTGSKSALGIGYRYGAIIACLRCMFPDLRIDEITPSIWKKKLGLTQEKKDSVLLCEKLFGVQDFYRGSRGGLKHDRCEALLLADLCRKNYN